MPCSLIYTLATQQFTLLIGICGAGVLMHFRMGIEGDVKLLEVIMEAFRHIYFMGVLRASVKCIKRVMPKITGIRTKT